MHLSPGDIFIDVGANIGYFTCLASKIVGPEGIVHAIEASPNIYRLLLANIELNHASNVTAHNYAVYNSETNITLYKGHSANIGASTTSSNWADRKNFSKEAIVPAARIGSIVSTIELFKARLIKIDVEGAEEKVVDGLTGILQQFDDDTEWLIEVTPNSMSGGNTAASELIQKFLDCGYTAYAIDNIYDISRYIEKNNGYTLTPLGSHFDQQIDILFSKSLAL